MFQPRFHLYLSHIHKHTQPCNLEKQTSGHKPVWVFLMNQSLYHGEHFQNCMAGELCCLWCDVQPVHIRSRRRKHTAQSHKYQGSPTGLFQAVLNQTPQWAVLSCRSLCKWAWSILGKQRWLVNSTSLHQWAEKALDNMLWVVDLFDCIVAKWELFCNIDS